MIAYLEGTVHSLRLIDSLNIILIVGGVGYSCTMPKIAHTQLKVGSTISLHTSQVVREDSLKLYGFLTKSECDLFEQLISVSGVGPKIAIAMLSVLGYDKLLNAIENNDVKQLASTPGLGTKGASKVILDLKGKLVSFDEVVSISQQKQNVVAKLISAITSLGFKANDAKKVADDICKSYDELSDDDLPELLRRSLQTF